MTILEDVAVTPEDRAVAEAIVSDLRGFGVKLPKDGHQAIQRVARYRLQLLERMQPARDAAVIAAALASGGIVWPDRSKLMDALEAELGDALDCTRVWEAWSYGTMGPDDFTPTRERLEEIADTITTALTGQAAPAMPSPASEELERLRKFRDAVEQIAVTEYFSGRMDGLVERNPDDDAEMVVAWEIVAAEIEPMRRESDEAAGIAAGWHRDEVDTDA